MRDLLLLIFFVFAVYYTFKRPFIGVCAWVWIAMTAPTLWAFGFSTQLRMNFSIVLVTFLAYIFSQKEKSFKLGRIGWLVIFFSIWTLISSLTQITLDSDKVWGHFIDFIKVVALYFFTILTIRKRHHIETFIWCVVLSVSSYAAMEGFKFILSGGSHEVIGRAGVIEDRNDFAVAVNMCLPLILYLIYVTKHYYLKLGLWGLFLLNVVAMVGTMSRGGFIGLTILAIAFWWKSKQKVLWLLLASLVIPIAYQYTPEDWRERQSTIQTASTEDASFIGRLWAWKISFMIARDNPLTGGGFRAVTDPLVWSSYAPFTPYFGPIETPPIPPEHFPLAAHNIYMQVLGDHGYVGLFIFGMILLCTLLLNRGNRKLALKYNQQWCVQLSNAITLSLIGYGVTGNNVSLAYFDLLYAIAGIVTVIATRKLHSTQPTTAAPPLHLLMAVARSLRHQAASQIKMCFSSRLATSPLYWYIMRFNLVEKMDF